MTMPKIKKYLIANKLYIFSFSAALMVRIFFLLFWHYDGIYNDSIEYDQIGLNLSLGKGFSFDGQPTARRSPLYPLFLGAIYYFVGHNLQVIRFLQALIDAFTVIMTVKICKKFSGEKTAFIAGLLLSIHPVLIGYTGLILCETLSTFVFTIFVYFIYSWLKNKKENLFLYSAFFFGVLLLIKPVLLFMPILIAIIIYYFKRDIMLVIKKLLLVYSISTIILSPWILRNYHIFKSFIPFNTRHGELFIISLLNGTDINKITYTWKQSQNYSSDEIEQTKFLKREIQRLKERGIKTNLSQVFKRIKLLPKFWVTSHSSIFGIEDSNSAYLKNGDFFVLGIKFALFFFNLSIFLMFLAGNLISVKKYDKQSWLLLLSLILYFSIHLNNVGRYFVPALPLILIFSSITINHLIKNLSKKKPNSV